ncbi:hypothetical protein ABPG72_019452 [Tetrahymena utriculariae]
MIKQSQNYFDVAINSLLELEILSRENFNQEKNSQLSQVCIFLFQQSQNLQYLFDNQFGRDYFQITLTDGINQIQSLQKQVIKLKNKDLNNQHDSLENVVSYLNQLDDFQGIHFEIFSKHLIFQNFISQFISKLNKFKNLTEINFNMPGNQINNDNFACMSDYIKNYLNLQKISINVNNNLISQLGLIYLSDSIKQQINLKYLELNLNNNQNDIYLGIPCLLENIHSNLQQLNLDYNQPANDQTQLELTKKYLKMINLHSRITLFNLDFNYFTTKNVYKNELALQQIVSVPQIFFFVDSDTFTLDFTKMNTQFSGGFLIEKCIKSLVNHKNLKFLNLLLKKNHYILINQQIFSHFQSFQNLTHLNFDLCQCRAYYFQINKLFNCIKNLINLIYLNLNCKKNYFDTFCTLALAESLKQLKLLQIVKINLSKTYVKYVDTLIIVKNLRWHSQLKCFSFHFFPESSLKKKIKRQLFKLKRLVSVKNIYQNYSD